MSDKTVEKLVNCQELWTIASEIRSPIKCPGLVEDLINKATSFLKAGLLSFKKYSEESLQALQKTNPPSTAIEFTTKLAQLLDLDAVITWDLIRNYVCYEFHKSYEYFASKLEDVNSAHDLIESICTYYYCERITLLKCLKLMIEYRTDPAHPYQQYFSDFFTKNPLETFVEPILEQIEQLKYINPPTRSQLFTQDRLRQLYDSSLIETRELVHVLTMILRDVHLPSEKFSSLYKSSNGEPRRLISNWINYEDKENARKKMQQIEYSQVALMIVALDVTRNDKMEEWIRGVRDVTQGILEQKRAHENSQKNGPFFLAWMLGNYVIESDNQDVFNKYRIYGIKALQLNVFSYLQGLMNEEMMEENTRYAKVVGDSVYNLTNMLGLFLGSDRFDLGVFDFVSSVVKSRANAARFWSDRDEGLWNFYNSAKACFPYKFEPLTSIASGLAAASKDSAEQVAKELIDLTSISMQVPRQDVNHHLERRPYERDCLQCHNDFEIPLECRFKKVNLAQGVTTERDECDIIMWNTRFNYWIAFHHKIELILQQADCGISNLEESKTPLPDQVTRGFVLLEKLLSHQIRATGKMVTPTELSFEVVNRFASPVIPVNIYNLLASCMRIASHLVQLHPDQILLRMDSKVYPRFENRYQSTGELAQGASFNSGYIGSWLSSIEVIKHSYQMLMAYVDILSAYLKGGYDKEAMYKIEIPGIVFLLQNVVPKLDGWYFVSERERMDLWLKSIVCLHTALFSTDLSGGDKDERQQLGLIVAINLLHFESRHALLKLIRSGQDNLKMNMMSETDWINGKGFKMMLSVEVALSVVNILLTYRKVLGARLGGSKSPLETALYASPLPNSLLIVPTIVDYLYVWFCPTIQAQAVQLLKRFAEVFSMSLLVCMGMDSSSIRETFASRLSSQSCATEVKIAILQLVTVCLDRQPGLTEALFNITHAAESKKKRIFPRHEESENAGCTAFLKDYMDRVAKDGNVVKDELYESTMNLLRAMWYHRNEILVNSFRKLQGFWTRLLAPVLRHLVPDVDYSQILDILTLELFKCNEPEKDFLQSLDELMDPSKDNWEKLATFVLGGIPVGDDMDRVEKDTGKGTMKHVDETGKPSHEKNLEAWYQLLVVVTDERIMRSNVISQEKVKSTAHLALDKLVAFMNELSSNFESRYSRVAVRRIMKLLTSICLRCVSCWKPDETSAANDNNSIEETKLRLCSLVQQVSQNYRSLEKSQKQLLVALLVACAEIVPEALRSDNASLEYILGQACLMAVEDMEALKVMSRSEEKRRKLDKGERNKRGAADERKLQLAVTRDSLPATLTISLVTRLLRMRSEFSCNDVYESRKKRVASMHLKLLVTELMACINVALPKKAYMVFSKTVLTLLATVARSPYDLHTIEGEASAKLCLALIPPQDIKYSLLETLYNENVENDVKWSCKDWWPIYAAGLEFLIGLVTNETGSAYVSQVVTFLSSHEYLLMEIATLLRHADDPLAADLMQSLIVFISSLSARPIFWEAIQPSIRETLVKCTYLAYEITVNLLTRPRILKFMVDKISVKSAEELLFCDETLPSGSLKVLVNKLILLNTCCALSFVNFSPRLNSLVDTIYEQDDFWYAPMAEINFGHSQMAMDSAPRLTYGTIISSAQLFTQAQLYLKSAQSKGTLWKDEQLDFARREWERANPENFLSMHANDLRNVVNTSSSAGDYSGYLAGLDVTVPILSNPHLIKRPFDPLICKNTILSRATALAPLPGRVTRSSPPESTSPQKRQEGNMSDPWFSSMEKNNTRLALEVNLVLILCQALQGIGSPRLVLRDRQLIARETANELAIFFEFLEHMESDDWQVSATLVDAEPKKNLRVSARDDYDICRNLPARLVKSPRRLGDDAAGLSSTESDDEEQEAADQSLESGFVTSGCFEAEIDINMFLPLLGKLLKTVTESLDSSHYA